MRIEIKGGPYDGATVEIEDTTGFADTPSGAAAFYAGVPIHREGGKVVLRWSDLQEREANLRSIGPAIDRVLLLMHEHEFGGDK